MKSFLHGKKAIAADSLRPPPQFSAALPAGAHAHKPANTAARADQSAHVEVVKEGDKVVRLIVNCTCGERFEIDCLYPAGR